MNVFVLDTDPVKSAAMHCDKHFKMIVESMQLLCAAHHLHRPKDEPRDPSLYKLAHKHHPATKWVAEHPNNYWYVRLLLEGLLLEYEYRFHRGWNPLRIAGTPHWQIALDNPQHDKYQGVYALLGRTRHHPLGKARGAPKSWVFCMKARPECITTNIVESYRRFYIVGKAGFAEWRRREEPDWFKHGQAQFKKHGDIRRVEVLDV